MDSCADADLPLFAKALQLDGRLRDHDVQLKKTVQKREDAERQAQQDEWRRVIKDARVHDISLK